LDHYHLRSSQNIRKNSSCHWVSGIFIGIRLLSSSSLEHFHHHDHLEHVTGHEHDYSEDKESKGCEENLNIKAAYLETLSDALGAAGVIIAGIIMQSTNFYLADLIVSIGLAIFMLLRTWTIIKKAVHIYGGISSECIS
jgi:Co/Zn/Cd efflux system component